MLIDRYPNAVLTFFDPESAAVTAQMSVATGFTSNPQDVFFVSETKAYVSRTESNANPTDDPDDFDEGGDVLVINPVTQTILSRIDMQPYADSLANAVTIPRPVSFVEAGGLVWLALANLTAEFQSAGPGTIVGINPNTDEVEHLLWIHGLKNCGNLAASTDGLGIWGSCNGLFVAGAEGQKQSSGLFYVDLGGDEPEVSWMRSGDELVGQVVGFGVAPFTESQAFFVALGQLGDGAVDDRVMSVNRDTNEVVEVGVSAGAYELGIPYLSLGEMLLVPVASNQSPRIERAKLSDTAELIDESPVDSNPGAGLPPRLIGRFRF